MWKLGPLILCSALVLTAFTLPGCDGSSRQLQSLSISPAAGATQVQFTALGMFVGSSETATVNAVWWTTQPWTSRPLPSLARRAAVGWPSAKPPPRQGRIRSGRLPPWIRVSQRRR